MTARNRNELWARAVVEELHRSGVEWVVVAPGSRSTPLVLEAARQRELRTLVHVDERSAAFFALGVGKATGRPAAMITTSGTAVANLLPAVVEAAQSEVPLLLLTADRPPHLRGSDANQAIDQVHIFGRYVREYHELAPARIADPTLRHLRQVVNRSVAAAVGDPGGPVHLNLPFTKPLEPVPVAGDIPPGLEESAPLAVQGRVGPTRPFVAVSPRRLAPWPEAVEELREALNQAERPLLVAGPVPRPWDVGAAVGELSERWTIPLLADPLSGARYPGTGGELALGGYDLFLRDAGLRRELRPDLVIRVGATPTSATLASFLEELSGVRQVVVDGGGRWKDHLSISATYLPADPRALVDALGVPEAVGARGAWANRWLWAEARAREVVEARVAAELRGGAESRVGAEVREPVGGGAIRHEGVVLAAVAGATPADELLFVSNSMPVRDLDSFVPGRDEGLRVLGNRGASGIDGIVSTALGAGAGSGRRVTVVAGDLALIHDMNGLLALAALPPDHPARRVILVVVNNQGGGIFQLLPIREYEPAFTRFFATPQAVDPARVAALHGLVHLRSGVDGDPSLAQVLEEARSSSEPVLLEVRTHREENRLAHGETVEAVLRALVRSERGDSNEVRGK